MAARCMVKHTDTDGEVVRRVVTFTANENRVAKCLEAFGLQGQFELERYDPDFDEAVRIGDSDDVQTGCKLTLVQVKPKIDGIRCVAAAGNDSGSTVSIGSADTVPVLDALDSTRDSTAAGTYILNVPLLEDGLSDA